MRAAPAAPRSRRLLLALAGGVISTAVVMGVPRIAGATCAAPSITVEPTSVPAGGVVEVRGSAFGTDCNDTGRDAPPLGAPQQGIDVRFVKDGRSFTLARVDATADYEFAVRAAVPAEVTPGPGEVVARGARGAPAIRGAPVTVTAASPPLTAAPPPTILVGASEGETPGRAGDPTSWAGWAVLAGSVVVAATGGALVVRARSRRSRA